ncbi:alpha/beta hydrolase [Sulfitobacter sp. D35]|uniref:alpha/beta fold hydrolase n=1 Tax=Sulfitobacter sp. D35 TaxID=3083252 RepID=UPI00296EC5E8|nr:alpha/beta hydrolase [Sulfitobacter sp. D35]MDW4497278.1 alpha/beta hydrolase [Sulfitobacter sp. D35]
MEWTAEPQDRLSVNGTALEYACFGPPPAEAPTLVLLHEGLGCVALWRDFPRRLAEATGLGVLVYSRAGYGASDPVELPRPLDYMTREACDVLGPLMDAAGIRQAVLLGHSDGATIAAIYAGSVSDMRVRGLVLIAPHFFTEPDGLAEIRAAGEAYASGDLKDKLSAYHSEPDVAFNGWHDAWTDPAFESWNVADSIDHWRVPALVVQGDADPYGTLAQVREVEHRIYAPVETLILEGAKHSPHLERKEAVVAGIAEFCATLLRLERQEVALA